MSYKLSGYKVFIASPGGLDDERRAFAKEIEDYNRVEAVHRGVIFQAVGWEDTLPGIGRPQSIINEELKQCDYFILLLHDRWGSNPGKNKKNATSGTEEEYLTALDCFQEKKYSMNQIVCLFKSVPPHQLADPGPQLQKVIDFKRKIGNEKKLLYSNFTSVDEFNSLIRKNLAKWLRDDNSGGDGGYLYPKGPPDLPVDIEPKSDLDITNPIDTEIQNIIDSAWKYAKEGKLVDAEIEFSKALIESPSENQLLNFSRFLIGTGQLEKASVMIDRAIHLAKAGSNLIMKARAFTFKGIVLRTRGDLDGAEEMYKKSLANNEKLGRLDGMAVDYGNLGYVFQIRGDLDGAEEMYKKSLAINEKLGLLDGMASDYGNLGNVLRTRGDLDGAEEMYKKSLAITEKLGLLDGMASDYGNLGNVLQTRGDLDGAEEMHKKSLAIDEKLGRLQGMAIRYGNLGIVLKTRGDLDGAEEMYKKSLVIDEKLGRLDGMAVAYGNLGNVLYARGDLDGAEEMHKKSLAINEKLRLLEGLADQYGNLGNVLQTRGDLDGAEEMYKKSLVINEKLGRLQGMANQYGNLGNVLNARGDLDGAEEMYKKSLAIAKKVGLKPMTEVISQNLKALKKSKK